MAGLKGRIHAYHADVPIQVLEGHLTMLELSQPGTSFSFHSDLEWLASSWQTQIEVLREKYESEEYACRQSLDVSVSEEPAFYLDPAWHQKRAKKRYHMIRFPVGIVLKKLHENHKGVQGRNIADFDNGQGPDIDNLKKQAAIKPGCPAARNGRGKR